MKILIDGYFDRNLGDDLMMTLAAKGLSEHELYINSDMLRIDGAHSAADANVYDVYLKVTGSGFLMHNAAGIAYRVRDMLREKRCAKIHAVIGCNISGFPNKLAEKIIQKQLAGFDFITVRDKKSLEYIRQNIPEAKCEMYPDIVFSLPEDMIPDTKDEGFLGIAVHNSMDTDVIAQTADKYVEETDRGVLLFAFDTGRENDLRAAKEIYAKMQRAEMAGITEYTTIDDMLCSMKRCAVILGARLHSVVLAARMNIPFVPLAYSDKINGVLLGMGYDGAVFDMSANAEALHREIITPYDFKLDSEVVKAAGKHTVRLKEYLRTAVDR